METDRDKYGINPDFFTDEHLQEYIDRKTEDLDRIATQLEIAWEALYNRGLSDHK
jgi:hypothetical protein